MKHVTCSYMLISLFWVGIVFYLANDKLKVESLIVLGLCHRTAFLHVLNALLTSLHLGGGGTLPKYGQSREE